jgi:hypothetical protein
MFSGIASGATPIGSADRAPNEIFNSIKAKEDSKDTITPFGREFMLIKVE